MIDNSKAIEHWQNIDDAISALQEHWETLKPTDIQDWLDTLETESKKLRAALDGAIQIISFEQFKEDCHDCFVYSNVKSVAKIIQRKYPNGLKIESSEVKNV